MSEAHKNQSWGRRTGAPRTTLRQREAIEAWLFVSPVLAGFAIFFFGPLIAIFFYSVIEWNMLSGQSTYVGLENFRKALLNDPTFWQVIRNSFVFSIGLVPLNMTLALCLALTLSRPRPGVVLFRTIFFAPVVTSAIAWGIVWKFLLQGQRGAVNQLLERIGIDGPNWLREPDWAMVAVIVTLVIKNVGLNMILYLASLQAIPRDYGDAAKLEGASSWQVFRMVTWPLIAPTTLVILVITTIGSFKVFEYIYLMTGGGPENGTLVLAYYIYQQAFVFFDIGYGAALSLILFTVVLLLTILQIMLRRRSL